MSLMSAEGIGVQYGTRRVLQHMNFSIEAGEVVTIVGPNGAGKSVFLRVLIGAEQPSEGRVNRAPGLTIGYVPQRLSIGHTMPMSVSRFLALSGSSNAATNQTMLTRVGVSDRAKEQMASLSGGEFQRVLLAYALGSQCCLYDLQAVSSGSGSSRDTGQWKTGTGREIDWL